MNPSVATSSLAMRSTRLVSSLPMRSTKPNSTLPTRSPRAAISLRIAHCPVTMMPTRTMAALISARAAHSPTPQDKNHRELPFEVPAATARPALDQALDSPRNPVPPSPGIPLLLGLGVDYRKSSSISLTTVLDTSIIAFTLCWSPS